MNSYSSTNYLLKQLPSMDSIIHLLQHLDLSDATSTDQCLATINTYIATTGIGRSDFIYKICTRIPLVKLKWLRRHTSDKFSALMSAAKGCDIEAVCVLLQAGFDVNQVDGSGCNALMYAIRSRKSLSRQIIICTMLIEAGTWINFRNNEGVTALMLVILQCNPEIQLCALLLSYGALPNIITRLGNSCISMSFGIAGNQHNQLIGTLLAYRANINHRDGDGDTLLTNIFRYNDRMTIPITAAYLINHGADITNRNNNGKSIVDHKDFHQYYDNIMSQIERPIKKSQLRELWQAKQKKY